MRMVHQAQQAAECLLIAFRVASRSEYPQRNHFDFFDDEVQNGFTVSSLRIALSRVAQEHNHSYHFVLKKLPGGWKMLKQLPPGVYIVQCTVKTHGSGQPFSPVYPHFVALDTNHGHISDSMRTSLIDFTDSWSQADSHIVTAIGAIYKVMSPHVVESDHQ